MGMDGSFTTDSLKKRYFYKVGANIFGLVATFFSALVIPRGLGPKAYGDFNFLNNFFTQVTAFFDLGTSNGFYTKLSQRPKEFRIVTFYSSFIGIASLVMMMVVVVLVPSPLCGRIWPGQGTFYIYMAALLAILAWMTSIVNQMMDAYGLTVYAETGKLLQRLLALVVIVALFALNKIDLANYFYYNYFVLFALLAIFIFIINRRGGIFLKDNKLSLADTVKYAKEFYKYAHPLAIYGLIGAITAIFDRWILQVFGGSVQQGYFGLSNQIGAICFLFSGAMTPLIMREFSIAYNKGDIGSMARTFRKHIPLLYSMAAFIACFVAVNAGKFAVVVGGDKFKAAGLAVMIMALYPIHQTYGQLSNSIFFAAGRTKIYRDIGVSSMLIGLPLTFLLIAPKKFFGIDAGATGLAVKTVLLQFFTVNVQLYFNAKFLNLSFWKYIAHQILSVACLLAIAIGTNFAVLNLINGLGLHVAFDLLFSGMVYTAIVVCIVCYFPVIFGLQPEDLRNLRKRLWKR